MKTMIQWPFAVLCAAVLCAGCSANTKSVKKTPEEKPASAASASPSAPAVGANSAGNSNVPALKTVYFAYDQADLDPDALKILRENAAWLKAHTDVRVKTEGRCDERGTEEYNIALGERRARAVKQYYVHAGIRAARLATVSYGKDKPVCAEEGEACRAQNRQADGVIEPVRTASK